MFKNTLNNIIIDENEVNFNNSNQLIVNNYEKSLVVNLSIKKEIIDSEKKIINEDVFMNCSYIPQNSHDRTNIVDEKYSPFLSNNNIDIINNHNEISSQIDKIKPISMFSISEKYLQNVINYIKNSSKIQKFWVQSISKCSMT